MELSESMKEKMKGRLQTIINKKIQTTMIFPLSQFEASFGHLWGHNKNFDQLTEDEKMYRAKWETVRRSVLDNGNRNIRGCNQELENYSITWLRYRTAFIPTNKNGNR